MRVELCESFKQSILFDELRDQFLEYNKLCTNDVSATLFIESGILKLKSDVFSTVCCDFLDKGFLKEVRQSFGRSEGVYSFLRPLAKGERIKICDMTVGMGKDFFKFILAGHSVSGFERNLIFYSLVSDGVRRFIDSEESHRLQELFKVEKFDFSLKYGEAHFDETTDFDLIYYDPMFEDKSKKAAPKKGMQALKTVVAPSGVDEKENFIRKALDTAPKSMVYKCSGVDKGFPFKVKKEQKGKGFSYVYL